MESTQTEQLTRPIAQPRRPFFGGYLTLVFIFGIVFFLDQWTKAWVRENLAFGGALRFDWLPSSVRILHWRNSGAAFGFFVIG